MDGLEWTEQGRLDELEQTIRVACSCPASSFMKRRSLQSFLYLPGETASLTSQKMIADGCLKAACGGG